MCFLYFAAVVAMELLAKEPVMREIQGQSASWMPKSPSSLVYVNSCKEKLPNFDCPSSALLTMFMMFTGNAQSLKSTCLALLSCVRLRFPRLMIDGTGTNWHEVAYIASPRSNMNGAIWNACIIFYFFSCYLVLGVILCNLLTTLIVEFHKVVSEEEEPVYKEVVTQAVKDVEVSLGPMKHTFKNTATVVRMMQKLKLDQRNSDHIETVYEIMVGKKRNWRSVISHSVCLFLPRECGAIPRPSSLILACSECAGCVCSTTTQLQLRSRPKTATKPRWRRKKHDVKTVSGVLDQLLALKLKARAGA